MDGYEKPELRLVRPPNPAPRTVENYDRWSYQKPVTPAIILPQEMYRGIVGPLRGASEDRAGLPLGINFVRRVTHVSAGHEMDKKDGEVRPTYHGPSWRDGDRYTLLGDPKHGLPIFLEKPPLYYTIWLLQRIKRPKAGPDSATVYIPSIEHALREVGLPTKARYRKLWRDALLKWAGVQMVFTPRAFHLSAKDSFGHGLDDEQRIVIPVFAYAGTEALALARGEIEDLRPRGSRGTGWVVRFHPNFVRAFLDPHFKYRFALGQYLTFLRHPLAARLYEFLSPLIGYRTTDRRSPREALALPWYHILGVCGLDPTRWRTPRWLKHEIDIALNEVREKTNHDLSVVCHWVVPILSLRQPTPGPFLAFTPTRAGQCVIAWNGEPMRKVATYEEAVHGSRI